MTPERWLSEQIKEKGIKQSFVAEKTGIPYQKISASLTGHRKMKVDEYLSVCKVTGVNPFDYPVLRAEGEANA